jgi:hypothetical protein
VPIQPTLPPTAFNNGIVSTPYHLYASSSLK